VALSAFIESVTPTKVENLVIGRCRTKFVLILLISKKVCDDTTKLIRNNFTEGILMSRLQITELNSSDFGLEELTDEELLQINGGSEEGDPGKKKWWQWVIGGALIVAGVLTTPVAVGVALIGAGTAVITDD
jgi:hypothetical protein